MLWLLSWVKNPVGTVPLLIKRREARSQHLCNVRWANESKKREVNIVDDPKSWFLKKNHIWKARCDIPIVSAKIIIILIRQRHGICARPNRDFPPLLWGLSPLMVRTFPAYCEDFPPILRGLSPLIVRTFHPYCEDCPRLLWGLSPLIVRTFPAYFEDFPPLL